MDTNKFNAVNDSNQQNIKAVFEDIKAECNELFCCKKCSSSQNVHYHEYAEFIHSLSRNLVVIVNGITYHLDIDDFIIILPGDKHSVLHDGRGAYLSLAFDKQFLFSSVLSSSDLHYILPSDEFRHFKADANYTFEGFDEHVNGISPRSLQALAGKTVEECEQRKHFYRLAVRGYLSTVALFVLREWEAINIKNNVVTHDDKGIMRIEDVLHEIDVHYSEDITAASMAELCNMSYSYFSRYFKTVMKMTFSEYLNQKRIEEAEKLLKDTDIPIFDVAKIVGFSNTSYFIAQFKKRRLMTPKKYKSRYGNSKD